MTEGAIMFRKIDKDTLWEDNGKGLHVLRRPFLDELKSRVEWANQLSRDVFDKFKAHPAMSHFALPEQALQRARAARYWLEDGIRGWQDFVRVFRGAQRGLLELTAFSFWWEQIDKFNAHEQRYYIGTVQRKTRGVFAGNESQFKELHRSNVACYMVFDKARWYIHPDVLYRKKYYTSRALLVNLETPVSLYANSLHNVPHWAYLPKSHSFHDFQNVARGVSPRADPCVPGPQLIARRKAVQERGSNAGRNSKTSAMNAEIRRWDGEWPKYVLAPVQLFKHGMDHVGGEKITDFEDSRLFPYPPIHLFWGGKDPILNYVRGEQLFHQIEKQAVRYEDELASAKHRCLGLTTKVWRAVLSNTYWKQQWPKVDGPCDGRTS
ncbi:hypothetical protein BV25DRAFT_1843811, partial [Artomyces pyxidatus]